MPPVKEVFVEPSVRSIATWEPNTVRSALSLLSSGYYGQAAYLADAIFADDRVQAALATRFKGLLGLPMTFTPAEEENERAQSLADALEEDWQTILPESTAFQLLAYGTFLGAVPVELRWETRKPRWIPKLKIWHPSLLRYDQLKRQWLLQVGDARKEVPIEEGTGKWLIYQPFGDNHSWTYALIRAIAIPWLMKCYAQGDWAGYSEIHGRPIRVGKTPPSAQDGDMKGFADDLKAVGSDGVFVYKDPYLVELLEATSDTWKSFEGMIEWCDKAISIAMLGQNLTTDVTGGSHAAATVHQGVKQDIIEGDAQTLCSQLKSNVINYWTAYNFGRGVDSPTPSLETTPPPEDGKIYKYHLDYGVLTKDEIRARVGFAPMEEGGDEIPQPFSQTSTQTSEDTQPLSAKTLKLASGDSIKEAKGLVSGQQYIDALNKEAIDRAAQVLQKDVRSIISIIELSKNADDLKSRLLEHYKGMNEAELTELNRRAFLMANLAGRYSEVQDQESQ